MRIFTLFRWWVLWAGDDSHAKEKRRVVFRNFQLHSICLEFSLRFFKFNSHDEVEQKKAFKENDKRKFFLHQYLNFVVDNMENSTKQREEFRFCQHPKIYNSTFAHVPTQEFSFIQSSLFMYFHSDTRKITCWLRTSQKYSFSPPQSFFSARKNLSRWWAKEDEEEVENGYEVIWDSRLTDDCTCSLLICKNRSENCYVGIKGKQRSRKFITRTICGRKEELTLWKIED